MHIPDGFLSIHVCVTTWVGSAGCLGICFKKLSAVLHEKMVPLMGVIAAFIFVAQMINFPVVGGTSGHLLGGVLAAVLLGPCAATVVLTCVLVIQCLLFQDGGLTALGANIFNMAILGTWSGYAVYRGVLGILGEKKGFKLGIVIGSWISVVMASAICAFELVVSGPLPFRLVMSGMILIHSLIGMGEAIITVVVIDAVFKVRPDLISTLKIKLT